MNYELYMAEAIAEARRGASEGESPVGAVAVIDDAMVARAHDQTIGEGDPTAHAALLALRSTARKLGPRRLSEVTLFVTREPCSMCVGALVEASVGSLVFAVADDRRGAAGSVIQLARHPNLPHRISVVSGVREDEARGLEEGAAATA